MLSMAWKWDGRPETHLQRSAREHVGRSRASWQDMKSRLSNCDWPGLAVPNRGVLSLSGQRVSLDCWTGSAMPNPAAPNPAGAPQFQVGHHRRRVGEPDR
jgi:hypothetical protein